jgi:hypothetical protein
VTERNGTGVEEPGKQQLQDMMSGKLVVLPSDAFGPCFRRVTLPLRRYQLGLKELGQVHLPRIRK